MGQFSIPQQAAAAATQRIPLTNDMKSQWNGLIDYLDKRGYKGSPDLDNRDTRLGERLMNEYKAQNPHFTLTYDQIPVIQQGLQDYRTEALKKIKSGGATVDGLKDDSEFMAGLSPSDGWLGSKTSSWKYPTATLAVNGDTTKYGVNTAAYDAAIAKLKNGNK